MNSCDKSELAAMGFWAIILISIVIAGLMGVRYLYVKTSTAIVNYQDGAEERKDAQIARAKEKESSAFARATKYDESRSKRVAANVEKKNKAEAKKRAKKDKHLAKLKENASWDNEFGNLMYHADGSLRDPSPGDGYTASQNYWILVMAVVGVMCVWAGVGTRHPLGMAFACIVVIVIAIFVCFVW